MMRSAGHTARSAAAPAKKGHLARQEHKPPQQRDYCPEGTCIAVEPETLIENSVSCGLYAHGLRITIAASTFTSDHTGPYLALESCDRWRSSGQCVTCADVKAAICR